PYHLLAEVYNSLEQWDDAIQAATAAIDNPNFSLMTARFGANKDQSGEVYDDQFKRNNQNRHRGNREALWVDQFEYKQAGGGESSRLTWEVIPFYIQLKDPQDVNLFIGPTKHTVVGRSVGYPAPTI